MATTSSTESASAFSAGNLFSVRDKVALITGGGTGIGLMAAKALIANGAKTVYITGRRRAVLDKAADEVATLFPKAQGYGALAALEGDVTSKDSVARMREAIQEGYLDILINNAGVEGPVTKLGAQVDTLTADDISRAHLDSESASDWTSVFQINTHALFFVTMTLLPLLEAARRRNGDASVVNITSISGIVKYSQNHYAYNASKAAANSLTLMLAHELNFRSHLAIRVNALAPGLFASEMTAAMLDEMKNTDKVDKGTENPAGRTGTEAEMASAILFLATNAFTTGQIVAVDGGFITGVPGTR